VSASGRPVPALAAYLEERVRWVDHTLERLLPPDLRPPRRLYEAMRYSLTAPGKRIRPVLLLAACEAVGGDPQIALPAAAAVEMIHAYSLIHDDLPAMDDDDLRRGRPANHRVYGEATAILAGDGLLTTAFEVLASAELATAVDVATRLAVIFDLAHAAGPGGMVGGQAADLEASDRGEVELPELEFIHTHKTGALIAASLRTGARLGGGSDAQIETLTRYGRHIGLAFQIADDILDQAGESGEGEDPDRHQPTYPALLGLAASRDHAEALVDRALLELEPFGTEAAPLRSLARYIGARTH
jgi:geranylgeranyl diphosphate synthase type II